MKKLAAILSFSVTLVVLVPFITLATSGAPVVIEEVQSGTSNYRHEFATLRNRTADVINLDLYKVTIADSKGVSMVEVPLTGNLAPYALIHIISEPYMTKLAADGTLSQLDYMTFKASNDNALSSEGGHVILLKANNEIDRLGYGSAANPEGESAAALRSGVVLKRCTDLQGMSIDTDSNAADFYLHDTSLDGLPGKQCEQPPVQVEPPCSGLVLSEILSNPAGADTGKEFIEVYNPTDASVSLEGCSLVAGGKAYDLPATEVLNAKEYRAFYDSETGLTLPNSAGGSVTLVTADTEEVIEYPGNLKDDVSWSLVVDIWQETDSLTPNAANKMNQEKPIVGGRGGSDLAPCPEGKYRHPETNRCRNNEVASTLTPCKEGQERNPATNRCRSVADATQLAPCKEGQERNPETNRCRTSASAANQLTPCRPGQERNPDTNRCRSVTASSSELKPCNADQYRNPETNRCKKIDGDTGSLKPCAEGQERNPETNRCRKIRDTAEAAFAVDETPPQGGAHYGWWAAGVAATGALGYGVYEWRKDIGRGFMRLRHLGRKDPPDTGNMLP